MINKAVEMDLLSLGFLRKNIGSNKFLLMMGSYLLTFALVDIILFIFLFQDSQFLPDTTLEQSPTIFSVVNQSSIIVATGQMDIDWTTRP